MPKTKQPKKLDELFNDGLRDIYFAEKKILVALPKMAKAAESEELANAFKEHEQQTKEQVRFLSGFELGSVAVHGN